MSSVSVFISYSHKDEAWKERLMTQLKVLQVEGALDIWDDRRIQAGQDWFPEITQAIEQATVAIFLISADFLGSEFIRREEIPRLLKRRGNEGLRVIPLIVRPCVWLKVPWLAGIQARPKDGEPLSGHRTHRVEGDLAALANEIDDILRGAHPEIAEGQVSEGKAGNRMWLPEKPAGGPAAGEANAAPGWVEETPGAAQRLKGKPEPAWLPAQREAQEKTARAPVERAGQERERIDNPGIGKEADRPPTA
jgi:hypothetical protein